MPDYLRNRKQVWVRTAAKDADGNRILKPTGYDIGTFNGQEVFEPGVDPAAIRKDGLVTDHEYTGFLVMSDTDLAIRAPLGAGFGGLRRFAMS